MAAPGLERHRLALLAAKEDVGNPRAGTNWAVFAYEKYHDLKLLDSGAGGPDELAEKFSTTSIMYGLCRVQDPGTGTHRIVLINWVGEKAPESQREACARHLPTIRAFFREASMVLSARRVEEVTQEGLSRALAQLAPTAAPALARRVPPPDAQELVGTNYRKTNPALEIHRTKRDSFWAQAEREEEQRKEEERRRVLEERKRWERERMEEERREAAERELRFKEKERMIEEQRKEQARLEAEERRKEKARWEQQQREYEEAMRDRGRRSESIEKAAEAAVLVSQRSQNPRDFFRQRERSGSTSGTPLPTPHLGTRPGARRPFLRYQRSLTESAFIFRRPDPPPLPGPLQPGAFRAVPPPPPPPAPGSPLSPAKAGPLHATSPTGTRTPPCANPGSPPTWPGLGPPPTRPGPGTLPPASPPRTGCPPAPPGSESSDSTCESLPPCSTLGLGSPGSPPWKPPADPEEAMPLPPPSPPAPPPDEDGPPLDTFPLPSPPAWGSLGLPVELGKGVLSPQGGSPLPGLAPAPMPGAGTPPRSPSPPQHPARSCSTAPGPQPGPGGQQLAGGNSGLNSVGGHEPGGWPAPWERDTPPREGDEPRDSILLPEPLHKAKPGFALLLARDAPHPQLPGGTSPPAEDEDLSPHTV
ncbi:LOW QUALITY PROTEIN: drebrin-like protein A [Falco biarmicus]|uniref:LOW QUALITY PROTEIN: drebrin-like protein A n=1 Tax=Falco biarmicus TaxID=345155 RepID=UPI0024BBF5B2|nr:LOW QUALITY PROTEIN: drebrin-like protein A [Falco biarmicus]